MTNFSIQSSNEFLTINKKLLTKYGLDLTVYISILIDKYCILSKLNSLTENKMFSITDNEIFLSSGIPYNRIKKLKKQAQELKLISISDKYYQINFELLSQIISEKIN